MYLGIEIGGTKLQLGVGSGIGSKLERLECLHVDVSRGSRGILEQIQRTGRDLIDACGVSGIGIGFGGPIDAHTGRVLTSHQVEGWDDFPLVEWCHDQFGLPVVLGNDCDAAALAEARLGAGRRLRTVFYVTVGTGIGGGLVIDGRLHGKGCPAVAEIGHLRPGLDASTENMTVESVASGRGIENFITQTLLSQTTSSAATDLLQRTRGDSERLSAKIIALAASDGNPIARAAIDRAVATLGWAIAQVVTLIAPNVVVVGGGVSLMGEELFFTPLRTETRRYVFGPLADSFEILPAELGEAVVVHGAVAFAASEDDVKGRAGKGSQSGRRPPCEPLR